MNKQPKAMDADTAQRIYALCQYEAARLYIMPHASYDIDDLASVGFIKAAESYHRWDAEQGLLGNYLQHRIRGAILDYIRAYTKNRYVTAVYKDYQTKHFSTIESSPNVNINNMLEDKSGSHENKIDITDELNQWCRKNKITNKEWLILILRFGERMSLRAIGTVMGISESAVCHKTIALQKRFRLKSFISIGPHPVKESKTA